MIIITKNLFHNTALDAHFSHRFKDTTMSPSHLWHLSRFKTICKITILHQMNVNLFSFRFSFRCLNLYFRFQEHGGSLCRLFTIPVTMSWPVRQPKQSRFLWRIRRRSLLPLSPVHFLSYLSVQELQLMTSIKQQHHSILWYHHHC